MYTAISIQNGTWLISSTGYDTLFFKLKTFSLCVQDPDVMVNVHSKKYKEGPIKKES